MTKDELSKDLDNTVKLLEKIKSEIEKTHKGMNYLTLKQVSEKTGVCKRTVNDWLHHVDQPLPYYRTGKVKGIIVREDELDKFLQRFKVYPRQRVERLFEI